MRERTEGTSSLAGRNERRNGRWWLTTLAILKSSAGLAKVMVGIEVNERDERARGEGMAWVGGPAKFARKTVKAPPSSFKLQAPTRSLPLSETYHRTLLLVLVLLPEANRDQPHAPTTWPQPPTLGALHNYIP